MYIMYIYIHSQVLNTICSICIMFLRCMFSLVLNNQSACTFLGKTISAALSIPYLPVVLTLGLRPPK